MLKKRYARWMYDWEYRLTTRDENRVVRPLEWGFEWVEPFLEAHGFGAVLPKPEAVRDDRAAEAAMVRINDCLIRHSDVFFGYEKPTDFRLEERYPMLFPTNVRPETLAQEAELRELAAEGKMEKAQFLRFTSPERTAYPENDLVNARWYPAPAHKDPKRPRQAIVVLPQWNADGFSHNSLCDLQQIWCVGAATVEAVSRYSPAERAGAVRLRSKREHRADDFGVSAGGGGYSLLHRLAGGTGV